MRTLILGDVHGCAAELEELLAAAAFAEDDRLIFVGDLVARGPDTRRVLALARDAGAVAIRGNHEQRLLDVRRARARAEEAPRLSPGHERVFAELDAADWQLLEAMPLWHELPDLALRVVHAGIVPGRPMPEQQPWALLHMRTLRDGEASDKRGGELWGRRYQGPPHIVFGHNAVDGLQLHPHATGLDTGCVYGGSLSALVLRDGEEVPAPADRRDCIVSVKARRAYVSY